MPEQFRVLVCNEVVELKTSVHFFLLGEKDIPGLTDTTVPRRLGPKRASRIRKLFNLSKEDDVRQYVVRKPLNKDGKKPRIKVPKIQRLVTPQVLQHKRWHVALKSILRKIKKRLQNMLNFWPRE